MIHSVFGKSLGSFCAYMMNVGNQCKECWKWQRGRGGYGPCMISYTAFHYSLKFELFGCHESCGRKHFDECMMIRDVANVNVT